MTSAVAVVAVASTAIAKDGGKQLPAAAARTLTEKFPGATILSVGREREEGVRYYEVNLRRGKDRIEVEIAPDGSIGEIESVVTLSGLPKAHQKRIREAVGKGKIRRVEKHVRVGRGKNGVFAPLKTPVGFYEVKCYAGDRRREAKVALDPAQVWAIGDDEDDEEEDDEDDE